MSAQQRIPQLDLLRFVAACMVVGFHYFVMGPFFGLYASPPESLVSVARYGYYGVPLFFMISGFVISMSAEGNTATSFLKARFMRLFPVFWAACTLTFLTVHFAGPKELVVTGKDYLASLTMVLPTLTKNPYVDGVYWTLFIEWQFYAGVALLLALGQFNRRRDWFFLAWLAVSAELLACHVHGSLMTATAAQFAPYFVAGSAFHAWYTRRATTLTWVNLMVSIPVAALESRSRIEDVWQWNHYHLNLPVVLGLLAIFYLVFTALCTRRLEHLAAPSFHKLGALTYSLYLVHQYVGYAIIHELTSLPASIVFPLTIGVAILLAAGLHYGVEAPSYRAFKRYASRLKASSAGGRT